MTDEQAIQAIDYYHERFERLGWAENEVLRRYSVAFAQSEKERCAHCDCDRQAADFCRTHCKEIRLSPYLETIIGPGLNNKDSSKAALGPPGH